MATERSGASTTLSSRKNLTSGRMRSASAGLCSSMLNGPRALPNTETTASTTEWYWAGTSDLPVMGATRGMGGSFQSVHDTLSGRRRTAMDARDLFLDQHAAVHSAAVGGNKMSAAERTFAGLSDEQMRVRPREDLNSLAWLMFHIARAEDIMGNTGLAGGAQAFHAARRKKLGITRRAFGNAIPRPQAPEPPPQGDPRAPRP